MIGSPVRSRCDEPPSLYGRAHRAPLQRLPDAVDTGRIGEVTSRDRRRVGSWQCQPLLNTSSDRAYGQSQAPDSISRGSCTVPLDPCWSHSNVMLNMLPGWLRFGELTFRTLASSQIDQISGNHVAQILQLLPQRPGRYACIGSGPLGACHAGTTWAELCQGCDDQGRYTTSWHESPGAIGFDGAIYLAPSARGFPLAQRPCSPQLML